MNNNTQIIGYSGKVNIKIFDNKLKISEINLHNTGYTSLFEYICTCLAGNYSAAEKQLPCKLTLYNKTGETYYPMSGYIEINEDPKVSNSNSDDNISSTTTLHFLIPRSQIVQYGTQTKINAIVLYPKNIGKSTDKGKEIDSATIKQKACADVYLADAIDINNISANFSLSIEWTLQLANK